MLYTNDCRGADRTEAKCAATDCRLQIIEEPTANTHKVLAQRRDKYLYTQNNVMK